MKAELDVALTRRFEGLKKGKQKKFTGTKNKKQGSFNSIDIRKG